MRKFQTIFQAYSRSSIRPFEHHSLLIRKYTQTSQQNERPEFPGSKSIFTNNLKFIELGEQPIPIFRVMNTEGEILNPKYKSMIDTNLAKRFHKEIIKLNQMDNILYEAQRQGRISFYMTSYGEEATHFGPAAGLESQDMVFGQYREPGVLMWRGFTFEDFINQCYSNELDLGKGRQMPIHYGSKKLNFMTIKSTLTSQMLHAVGVSYAFKLTNKNAISLVYFGEGAASEGDAYAAFNFASTLDCPVIFLCRNNGYAISTPTNEQYRGDGVAIRGPALGIPSIRVDGNDIFACYIAIQHSRKIAIEQNRPVLVEAMTYRISHHSTSDDSTSYRKNDEIKTWKEREHPLSRIEKFLKIQNAFDEEKVKEFQDITRKEIIAILHRQESINKPSLEALFTDVYDRMTPIQKEQYESLKNHLRQYSEYYPKNFQNYEKLIKK